MGIGAVTTEAQLVGVFLLLLTCFLIQARLFFAALPL
jgi:hypothetical protein